MKELYTAKDVEKAANRLSHAICTAYSSGGSEINIVFIGILKGGAEFLFRLMHYARVRGLSYTYGFMAISSYEDDMAQTIEPQITYFSVPEIKDRVVIIVDDIVDGGNTMNLAKKHIKLFDPKKIETISLVMKAHSEYPPDRFGLLVDKNVFVVGTGMGIGEKHRDKPGIWICEDAPLKEIAK